MTRKKLAPRRAKKRPYRTPQLKVHGDLKTMTLVKGGSTGDAGKPVTRSSGAPG